MSDNKYNPTQGKYHKEYHRSASDNQYKWLERLRRYGSIKQPRPMMPGRSKLKTDEYGENNE